MKRAVDIGPLDAAAIRTRGGKIRLRLHFTIDQLETMLRAAMADDGEEDEETIEANIAEVKRSVTQCNAKPVQRREEQNREIHDEDDARARPHPRVFVIEGTKAWNAWLDHRKRLGLPRSLPTCQGMDDHANRRGWWMPSLFPPATEMAEEPVEL